MLLSKIRSAGLAGLFQGAYRRLIPHQIAAFDALRECFSGKIGLEVGGASAVFGRRGLFPVYPLAARIDNCNFRADTIWNGSLEGGLSFRFDRRRPCGRQYFLEATDLKAIADVSYDFVLSSHALEHVANPLLALSEWKRVIKPGGTLVLVLPHMEGTFDHRRPVTALEHMIADFDRGVTEEDTTHVEEILRLHDLSRDLEAGDIGAFSKRAADNLENRGLHHHVFVTASAIELVDHAGLGILAAEAALPYHIFVAARKPEAGEVRDNGRFRGTRAGHIASSPFMADKRP